MSLWNRKSLNYVSDFCLIRGTHVEDTPDSLLQKKGEDSNSNPLLIQDVVPNSFKVPVFTIFSQKEEI